MRAAKPGDSRCDYPRDCYRNRQRPSRLTLIETGRVQLPPMKPTTRRVLRALLAAGTRGATTAELCKPEIGGIRFGGRVHELRALGFRIDTARLRNGSSRYTLIDNEASARLFAPPAEAA